MYKTVDTIRNVSNRNVHLNLSGAMMAEHTAVARRFAELLESLDLDRHGFVQAVDGAVTERSLYSILNGHRRPSRSLAVLIERTWGYRADYLLRGEDPAWRKADRSADTAFTADEAAILSALSGSPDIARTLRRDLDDSVLWTELWQRTGRMLQQLEQSDSAMLQPADRARVAFSECMAVADAFGELNTARYQRRLLHLVVSFISQVLDRMLAEQLDGVEGETFRSLLAEAEAAREILGKEEGAIRVALQAKVREPSPLSDLEGETPRTVAGRLLSNRIAEVLHRRR